MQTILFIELLGGIGDLLMALPAIQAIGRSYPQAKLTVLTFTPGSTLLNGDPLIDRVIGLERQAQPNWVRDQLAVLLDRCQFDLIVSDTNYDGIEQLIQTSGAARVVTNLWRSPPAQQRVSDRFLNLLLADGIIQPTAIAPPQVHLTAAERLLAQHQLATLPAPLVVLYPEAGMAIKHWPIGHFVQLGQALQQQGATVIVPMGAAPAPAIPIVNGLGDTARVWEQGSLRSLAALMATVDLVIAADTGPAHLAAALHTPTITLFGPAWHDRYGQPDPHLNLQGQPDCPERQIADFTRQVCWYSGVCPFELSCMQAISPAAVLAAAARFLPQPAVAR